jgi:hypothetical protein
MTFTIPDNPDQLLPRDHTAHALTAAGYPIKPKTLATKATRGGGPPYRLFGPRALYRWGDALSWAQSRMSAPRRSSSETDVHSGPLSPVLGDDVAGAEGHLKHGAVGALGHHLEHHDVGEPEDHREHHNMGAPEHHLENVALRPAPNSRQNRAFTTTAITDDHIDPHTSRRRWRSTTRPSTPRSKPNGR